MKELARPEYEKLIYERNIARGMSDADARFDAVTSGSGLTLWPEREIIVTSEARTRTKLHEVGHKAMGQRRLPGAAESEPWTVGDEAYTEILAEKYAWEAKGKKITYRIAWPAALTLMYNEKMSPSEAVGVVVQVMEQYMGMRVPPYGKKELRRWARKYRRIV